MKHCTNCNALLKEGAKFCTNCGTPIEDDSRPTNRNDTSIHKAEINKPKSSSKGTKILIGLIVLAAVSFTVKSLVSDIDLSRNSISVSRELNKIVGEWHEPSEMFLGDHEIIITFRTRGDIVVGEDLTKRLYIQLLPISQNKYSGLVVLDGDDDDFLVDYYPGEKKMVFFSTLTKTSWYLIKK